MFKAYRYLLNLFLSTPPPSHLFKRACPCFSHTFSLASPSPINLSVPYIVSINKDRLRDRFIVYNTRFFCMKYGLQLQRICTFLSFRSLLLQKYVVNLSVHFLLPKSWHSLLYGFATGNKMKEVILHRLLVSLIEIEIKQWGYALMK